MRPVATQPRQLRDRPHQPPRFGSKIGEAMSHNSGTFLGAAIRILILIVAPHFTKLQPSRIVPPPNITAKRTTLRAPSIAPRRALSLMRRTQGVG